MEGAARRCPPSFGPGCAALPVVLQPRLAARTAAGGSRLRALTTAPALFG